MGGAGCQPAPLGNLPSEIQVAGSVRSAFNRKLPLVAVPSGKLPDGTGGQPVLPNAEFPHTLLAVTMQCHEAFALTPALSPRANHCAHY